jgi:hypothetical protein
MQLKIGSKNLKQKLEAKIGIKNWKQKLELTIAILQLPMLVSASSLPE